MVKNIIKKILSYYLLPKNRWGDKIYSFLSFVYHHKRKPLKNNLINDFFYSIKTSEEILNPLREYVTDKEFLKLFIKDTAGDQHNVETYAILYKPNDVDLFNFPTECCIKPTHASGVVILRKNNSELNKNEIKSWFKLNHYLRSREAVYKNLIPKIIVEPIIFNNSNLNDYKFHCLNGVVKFIQVDTDRFSNHKRYIFDKKWNGKNFSICYPHDKNFPPKPINLDLMIKIAEKISSRFNFVRVDLYSNNMDVIIGEITHCPGSGNEKFLPLSGEKEATKMLYN